MKITALSLLLLASAEAYNVSPAQSRRAMLGNVAAAAAVLSSAPGISNALSACPPKSKNCIATSWTAPSGADAAKDMDEIINSYPQEGQDKVDLGGWKVAQGDVKSGSARVEYTSGVGNFAKFLNGGKPFVDDLEIEISGQTVNIKSASRIGESDLDVNRKRLQVLANKAKSMGWTAPDPTY